MSSMRDITAVVLAGGMGTRLRPVVADRPKVVAEVCGRPFLLYLLDQLTAAGIRHIVMCTGYMADTVSSLLGRCYGDTQLVYSVETDSLGTGGALRLALPLLQSDPVLVMNGDSFCELDFSKFIAEHKQSNAFASLALAGVPDISRYGAVDRALDGTVTAFVEKGARSGPGSINAGIYLLPKSVISTIPTGKTFSLELDLFPELVGNGLYGFTRTGKFIDIGVPEDYQSAAKFFHNYPFQYEVSNDYQ